MRFRFAFVACVLTAFLQAPIIAAISQERLGSAKPAFAAPAIVSTNEGHSTLSWSLPVQPDAEEPGLTFELEQSRDSAFGSHRLRYRGPAQAFFVSGLKEGPNYFRVRAVLGESTYGPWSDPLLVDVDYPRRGRVVLLLLVGCVVFAGTAAAILSGWLRTRGVAA